MRVAVCTLTRDRLQYTEHCFASLRENAGCEFDHFVLDQGSQDGTPEWLRGQALRGRILLDENIGIPSGMNRLLEMSGAGYDVYVKFDNDCELTQPNTLRDIAELVHSDQHTLLSPRILGLKQPPAAQGMFEIEGETILDIPQIGGIFTAVPGWVFREFRYDESRMLFDDVELCWWFRRRGGRCGYLERLSANHYETTQGQEERYPGYFQRKFAEMH